MELNIDIEGMIAAAVSDSLSEDKIRPLIQQNLDKAIKSAIESQFSYRAPFNEMLQSKMAEAMPVDLEGFGRFGDLVLKTIRQHLDSVQQQHITQAIEPRLAQMLAPPIATMKLSELVDQLTEHFASDFRRDHTDKPTFTVERSNHSDGYWDFYADPKSNVSKYSCKMYFRFRGDGGCWSVKINESDITNTKYIGPVFGDERLALNLYTGQTKIELDEDDFSDIYYPEPQCHC